MKFSVLWKVIASSFIQIEFSPQYWLAFGLNYNQMRIVVMGMSLIVLIINISMIKFGIYLYTLLRVKKANSKPNIRLKAAHMIHTLGPIGLFLTGLFPWPMYIGEIQPLTYLLYCESDAKMWYKPNLGFMCLVLGVIIKMFFFIQ